MSEFHLPLLHLTLGPVVGYLLSVVALWALAARFYPLLRMLRAMCSTLPLRDRYGPGSWAVVTGASFGIGAEFCSQLAAAGYNIVLIARSQQVLKATAERLESQYRISTKVVVWDFSGKPKDFSDLLSQLSDLDVSILANNVGAIEDGLIGEHSLETVVKLLELNVWPVVTLSRWALASMSRRKAKSALINVSSIAASYPYAGMSVYSATKKFDDFLTISLGNEVAHDSELQGRVDVLSVRPGYVETGLLAGLKKRPEPAAMVTPKQCVTDALKSLGKGPYTAGARKHSVITAIVSQLPESLKQRTFLKKLQASRNS